MIVDDDARALLQEVLERFYAPDSAQLPDVRAFRAAHDASQRSLINELVATQHLKHDLNRYALTIKGLLASRSPEARRMVESCNELLAVLREAYRSEPGKMLSLDELAHRAGKGVPEVAKTLESLLELSITSAFIRNHETGLISSVQLSEDVLDAEPS